MRGQSGMYGKPWGGGSSPPPNGEGVWWVGPPSPKLKGAVKNFGVMVSDSGPIKVGPQNDLHPICMEVVFGLLRVHADLGKKAMVLGAHMAMWSMTVIIHSSTARPPKHLGLRTPWVPHRRASSAA